MATKSEQRQIYEILGQADDGLLTPEQVAAKQATAALVALLEMVGLIKFGNVNLSSLTTRFGGQQIVNDDGLWVKVEITDWIRFDNLLGDAALGLFLAAQARRVKLDRLARERAEIVAARQARNGS